MNSFVERSGVKKPQSRPILVKSARVIVGGPTSGKSTFIARNTLLGVQFVDTDWVIEQCAAWWWSGNGKAKLAWSAPPAVKQRFNKRIGEISAFFLGALPDAVLLTNMWDPSFISGLGPFAPGGKLPLGVFRTDGGEMSLLSEKRGGAVMPLSLTEKWARNMQKYAPSTFTTVIWLDKQTDDTAREYLSTVVELDYPGMMHSLPVVDKSFVMDG